MLQGLSLAFVRREGTRGRHFLGELTLAQGLGETAEGGVPGGGVTRARGHERTERGPQAESAVGLPGRARKQGLVGALQSCLRRSRVCLGRKAAISKEEVIEGQACAQGAWQPRGRSGGWCALSDGHLVSELLSRDAAQ